MCSHRMTHEQTKQAPGKSQAAGILYIYLSLTLGAPGARGRFASGGVGAGAVGLQRARGAPSATVASAAVFGGVGVDGASS